MTPPSADPCGPCGRCCRTFAVPLTGYDVWRIARGQQIAPAEFVLARIRGDRGPDGFHLVEGGPSYGLVLAKTGGLVPGAPCVFLTRQPDNTERCGIYPHRPGVCRAYPMAIWSGIVYQPARALCPPDAWDPAEPTRPGWRSALHAVRMDSDTYQEVVARWNAHVSANPDRLCALDEFYTYVLAVYDQVGDLAVALGDEELALVRDTWPPIPRADAAFVDSRFHHGQRPWLAYLHRVRAIADAFFPEVPPLPLRKLVPGQ